VIQGIAERDNDPELRRFAAMLEAMVDEGHLGTKTGQGFYSYPQPG
jgi:3-hydroxybutyryl-CoA dehydrogenase